MLDRERYREAILRKVCEHCVDLGENGHCTLKGDRQCGVEIYLDKILDVVHSVHSDKLENYVEELRKHVCSECKNQLPDGNCQLRAAGNCGLDRFFEIVVEAIEEVDNST